MKRPSRVLLILLLIPVLLLAAWLAVQDVWLPVRDWDVSPDGSRLVALINHGYPDRGHPDYTEGRIVLWDLRSRRQIASLRGDVQRVLFSPDGQTIVTGHDDGTTCFREAGTLAERMRFSIDDRYAYPVAFVRDEVTLLVCAWDPQFSTQYRLVRIDQGRSVGRPIPGAHAKVSADGQTFVVHYSESESDRCSVFRFSKGEPNKIGEFEFDHSVFCCAVSPDGRYAAMTLYSTDVVQLWNLSTGTMEREIRQPDRYSMAFVDNGRLLATSLWSGHVRLWKVASGEPAGGWRARFPLNLYWHPHRALNDCHVEAFRFAPITLRDLKTGEVLASLPMRGGTYYTVAIVECVLLIAWSIAWVVSGRQCRTPHPLLDVAMVHGVVAVIVLARFANTESFHLVRLPTGWLLLAQTVAASSLAAMWAVAADHRWMVRVSAALAALTGATAAMVSFALPAIREGGADWDDIVAAVSLVVCLACGVLMARRFGLRVGREPSIGRRKRSVHGFQVMLRDLFVFTSAIAAFVAVARFFEPPRLDSWETLFLICEGAMFALVAGAGTWSALARARWPLRAMVLIMACILSEAHWPFLHTYLSLEPLWWYLSAHSLVAVIVATTLLVFRVHGYRIRTVATES